MARIVEEELPDMPGQDAFLDVLTNMVGIIILLVVVIGHAHVAGHRARRPSSKYSVTVDRGRCGLEGRSSQDAQRVGPRRRVENSKALMRQVVEVRGETSLREQERDYLSTYVAAFEQELNERRSTLSAEQQRDFDLRRKLAESQVTLENLSREQVALLSQPTEVEAIENQPTPLARRSTGKEVLLHLSGGHLAVIPHELVDETINDVKENLWRLRRPGPLHRHRRTDQRIPPPLFASAWSPSTSAGQPTRTFRLAQPICRWPLGRN